MSYAVRNRTWRCLFCGKPYRREFALLNHETKCPKRLEGN